MEKKVKNLVLIVAIIVVAVISVILVAQWIAQNTYESIDHLVPPGPEAPSVTYVVNKTAGTIIITSIEGTPEELVWSNVEVYNSTLYEIQATLPIGTIDEGDVITDCEGPVLLIWKPTGAKFIEASFV